MLRNPRAPLLQQGENTPSAFFPVSDIELEAALKACCAIPALTLSLSLLGLLHDDERYLGEKI